MYRNLQAWLLRRLDGLLTFQQRRHPPDELSRLRVLVGAAALNLAMAVSNMVGPEPPEHGTLFRAVGLVFSAGYLGSLVLARRSSSLRLPAILLCTTLTVGIASATLMVGTPQMAAHASIMLAPALAVYLLGGRLGFMFTALMMLHVLIINPLFWGGAHPGRPFFVDEHAQFSAVAGGVSLLGGWVLSYLHSSAREAAHAALQQNMVRLAELHRSLLEVSRQAGKAEIATSILHNVGNTLNSVTVSVGLVEERARALKISGVVGAARLLGENAGDPHAFLSSDSRGHKLPHYLRVLSEQLSQEQGALVKEVEALRGAVEHIQAVVRVQEENARPAGLLEQVPVRQLIEDALRLQRTSFEQAGIDVRAEYGQVPLLLVDRHHLLQILINLLSNARHALIESEQLDKQLTLRVGLFSPERLRIAVADNGAGILPEHLPRLFTQGFTTKKAGHGFGLHLSALAAQELGGSLTCQSEGKGHGATFTLELPLQPEQTPGLGGATTT
jgi:signal transduction histidine kinase